MHDRSLLPAVGSARGERHARVGHELRALPHHAGERDERRERALRGLRLVAGEHDGGLGERLRPTADVEKSRDLALGLLDRCSSHLKNGYRVGAGVRD